jgi:hypothetical protein
MWRARRVERHTHLMDGDMMVVPAQTHQIARIVIAAPGSPPDVVGLDPIATLAAVDLTSPLVTL